jgi:hypothetical protein
LLHIWKTNPTQWSNIFSETHEFLQALAMNFQQVTQENVTMEQARNNICQLLHGYSPINFPMGQCGAAVMNVLSTLLNEAVCGSIKLTCISCSHETEQWQNISNVMHIEQLFSGSINSIENIIGLNSPSPCNDICPSCGNNTTCRSATLARIPSIWAFGIYSCTPTIQYNLRVTVNDTFRILKLRGIIYFGQFHFTCRLFGHNQSIWYHDGQNGRSGVFEGYMQNIEDINSLIHVCNGGQQKTAVTVIYA